MKNPIKVVLGGTLRKMVFFKSHDYRVSALDLVKKTHTLRGDWSPLTLYMDWRHQQIERLNIDSYRKQPLVGDIFESYYGKIDRISLVMSFLQGSMQVPGDVAEFGVFKGHTAFSLHQIMERDNSENRTEKRLHLFDSFKGMPKVTHPLDGDWQEGDLDSGLEPVQELFRDIPRVNIVPGYFKDTLPQNADLKFCFCHVDSDLYTSVLECINYILPRLSVGGVIVFDDYGFRNCPGAKAAVEECFGQPYSSFVPLPTGQAVYFQRNAIGTTNQVASDV